MDFTVAQYLFHQREDNMVVVTVNGNPIDVFRPAKNAWLWDVAKAWYAEWAV